MSEWINVNERLPEKNGQYLVVCDNGYIFVCAFATDYYKAREEMDLHVKEEDHRPAWYEDDCNDDFLGYEYTCMTHWMPIPELPQ